MGEPMVRGRRRHEGHKKRGVVPVDVWSSMDLDKHGPPPFKRTWVVHHFSTARDRATAEPCQAAPPARNAFTLRCLGTRRSKGSGASPNTWAGELAAGKRGAVPCGTRTPFARSAAPIQRIDVRSMGSIALITEVSWVLGSWFRWSGKRAASDLP
jgi:hypothetical protein